MSNAERSMVFDSLDDEMVADIIEEFEPKEQAELLEAIEEERVPDVVAAMEPDDAADMLQELSPEETADILERMEEDEAEDVKELMEHERDSAGGLMTSDYVAVPVTLTAGEALEELRASAAELPAENSFTIFAVDDKGRPDRCDQPARPGGGFGRCPALEHHPRRACVRATPKTTPPRPRGWWPSTTCWRFPLWTTACWPASSLWTTPWTGCCPRTGASTCRESTRREP